LVAHGKLARADGAHPLLVVVSVAAGIALEAHPVARLRDEPLLDAVVGFVVVGHDGTTGADGALQPTALGGTYAQAWADSATDPLTRFELFRKNGTAALLATNGMFVSAEAMDLVRCREVMLGPLTRFSWESGKNDLVLKSIHLNRYLTAQRTHGDPEWLIQCSDSAPSRYSTFEQIA